MIRSAQFLWMWHCDLWFQGRGASDRNLQENGRSWRLELDCQKGFGWSSCWEAQKSKDLGANLIYDASRIASVKLACSSVARNFAASSSTSILTFRCPGTKRRVWRTFYRNGVIDTFRLWLLALMKTWPFTISQLMKLWKFPRFEDRGIIGNRVYLLPSQTQSQSMQKQLALGFWKICPLILSRDWAMNWPCQ